MCFLLTHLQEKLWTSPHVDPLPLNCLDGM